MFDAAGLQFLRVQRYHKYGPRLRHLLLNLGTFGFQNNHHLNSFLLKNCENGNIKLTKSTQSCSLYMKAKCRFHEQDGWDGISEMLIKFIYTILPMFQQTAGVRVLIYAQFEKYQQLALFLLDPKHSCMQWKFQNDFLHH